MSFPDTIFILLGALILFGPRKLPEIMRQVGKIIGELRRASNEFKFQMEEELRQAEDVDRRSKQAETPAAVMTPLPQPPQPAPPVGAPMVANRVSARAAEDPDAMQGILAPDGFVTEAQPPLSSAAEHAAHAEHATQAQHAAETVETPQNA